MIVGILGGGQLARMLILNGKKLGVEFEVYAPQAESIQGLAEVTQGDFDDAKKLTGFVEKCDWVTYEWENLPVESLRLSGCGGQKFFPCVDILEIISDRFQQKMFFKGLGVPTAPFALIQNEVELEKVVSKIGLPVVLKTNRFGYDGKGQKVIRRENDLVSVWSELGGVPLICEKFIPFTRELSLVACRGQTGEQAFYPLTESVHQKGILIKTLTPANPFPDDLQRKAQGYARKVFDTFKYVGVLALECFEVDGELLLNEMASRVHNTGHWSIEGSTTSQFENHIRAGLGLSLGETTLRGSAAMLNVIGSLPKESVLSSLNKWHVHLYGKQPKPGRKLGHLTLVCSNRQELEPLVQKAEELLSR